MKNQNSNSPSSSQASEKKYKVELNRVPIEWELDGGSFTFFGLNSALFWTDPSLLHTFLPLTQEVGRDLFRLLVAHSSTFGTKEDYHSMISSLGDSFAEGFLAWGKAVSVAGWGRFELSDFDPDSKTATVTIHNPWEVSMQRSLPQEPRWGCPFLQGKIIGIFTQAFGTDCWADELCEYGPEEARVVFKIHPSCRTIMDEIEKLRHQRMLNSERALAQMVEEKTAELSSAQEQLRDYSEKLEQQVAKRTEELAAANQQLKNEVSDRKLTEEKLRASQNDLWTWQDRYETAVRVSDQLLYDWNSATNDVAYGDNLEDILGFTVEEMQGGLDRWIELIHPDDTEYFSKTIEQLISTKGSVDLEFRIRRKDGVYINVRDKGSFVWDADGKPVQMVGFVRDVSKQKRAEEELQRMQKLKSIGTLAGGIAHDFNNILTGLFGNMAVARDELSEGHPAYEALQEAQSAMDRAIRLTKQLLTFARGGDPIREDLSIVDLVERVVRFDLTGSNVKPVFEEWEDLWMADVDKGQLQQVFSNLALNADQAMPEGGHLFLAFENALIDDEEMSSLNAGKYIRVTVRDEGTGIESKYLDRIFDPYFSTKQTGSGLGLATVYSIINKHRGHIAVNSTVGEGTTFVLYLPASDTRRSQVARPIAGRGQLSTRPGARILVMDDQEMIRKVAIKILTRNSFSVDTAANGEEAIEMYRRARESGKPYDAAIMDLTVPGGMGGKEALAGIQEIDPKARVIVSSGYAEDPVMANFADHGFKAVVEKPYNGEFLLEVLNQVLNA